MELRENIEKTFNNFSEKNKNVALTKLRDDPTAASYFGAAPSNLTRQDLQKRFIDIIQSFATQALERAQAFKKENPNISIPNPIIFATHLMRFYINYSDINLHHLNEISIALGWYTAVKNKPKLLAQFNLPRDIVQLDPKVLLKTYRSISGAENIYVQELKFRYEQLLEKLEKSDVPHEIFTYGVVFKPRSASEASQFLNIAADRMFICVALNQEFHELYSPYYVLVVDPAYNQDHPPHYFIRGLKGYAGMEFYVATFSDKHKFAPGLFMQLRNQFNIAVPLQHISERKYLKHFLEYLYENKPEVKKMVNKGFNILKDHPPYVYNREALKHFVENEILNPHDVEKSPILKEVIVFFYSFVSPQKFIEELKLFIKHIVDNFLEKNIKPNATMVFNELVDTLSKSTYFDDTLEDIIIETIHRNVENKLKFTPEDHILYLYTKYQKGGNMVSVETAGRKFAEDLYHDLVRKNLFGKNEKTISIRTLLFTALLKEEYGLVKDTIEKITIELERQKEEELEEEIYLEDEELGEYLEDEDEEDTSFEFEI